LIYYIKCVEGDEKIIRIDYNEILKIFGSKIYYKLSDDLPELTKLSYVDLNGSITSVRTPKVLNDLDIYVRILRRSITESISNEHTEEEYELEISEYIENLDNDYEIIPRGNSSTILITGNTLVVAPWEQYIDLSDDLLDKYPDVINTKNRYLRINKVEIYDPDDSHEVNQVICCSCSKLILCDRAYSRTKCPYCNTNIQL